MCYICLLVRFICLVHNIQFSDRYRQIKMILMVPGIDEVIQFDWSGVWEDEERVQSVHCWKKKRIQSRRLSKEKVNLSIHQPTMGKGRRIKSDDACVPPEFETYIDDSRVYLLHDQLYWLRSLSSSYEVVQHTYV